MSAPPTSGPANAQVSAAGRGRGVAGTNPGNNRVPTTPHCPTARDTPRLSLTPRPTRGPRAPRGEVRRVTCSELGEHGTTPEAPSRRPPLCLPPVRLPGGNGPPCAPAPGPPRAAPALPGTSLRALFPAPPAASIPPVPAWRSRRFLGRASHPEGSLATPGRDPQKSFWFGLRARRPEPTRGRRGGDSGNSLRRGRAGGGQVSHRSQLSVRKAEANSSRRVSELVWKSGCVGIEFTQVPTYLKLLILQHTPATAAIIGLHHYTRSFRAS
ncbi:basic proline-rich protein-like [Mus musculus]|uniref:basic proline-rich protein-like n=1 Tax=Mus musculus TaxID=10090 RepID=UPI00167BAF09|nr:basic proline-rich protein-like [Mus musculus]